MSLIRLFQIAFMSRRKRGGGLVEGENPPSGQQEWEILLEINFFSAGEHLRRSAFDHSNLFQIKKHHSVKSMKLK